MVCDQIPKATSEVKLFMKLPLLGNDGMSFEGNVYSMEANGEQYRGHW